MMKKKLFIPLVLGMFLTYGCADDENYSVCCAHPKMNKVLMLKVDYTTKAFEGGKEFTFSQQTEDFTIVSEYEPPGDFGSIKLTYQELSETLFDGTIVWMGLGEMNFPSNLHPANEFDSVETEDYVFPGSGFENVFNPHDENYDYSSIWSSVQDLVIVRNYLESNPEETVKLFRYTPSVGIGDPAEWDWIIYMKN